MCSDYSILIQFDILLARSNKYEFDSQDINELLDRIKTKHSDKKYCLDWFVNNDILVKIDGWYYHTGEKAGRYKPYKGYQKIVQLIRERDGLPIDFNLINLTLN